MAQSRKGGYAFVKDTFGLPVAVLCSEDASAICKKNRLTFVELLRPFCQLTTDVRIHDHSGRSYNATGLRVSLSEPMKDPHSEGKLKLLLSQTVRQTEGNVDLEMSNRSGNVDIAGPTPWYDNYRDDFIQLIKQSDHEYIRHYMGSLLVVSSYNENPVAAFTELYQEQKKMESQPYPKWLTPHVYCWHILLHDVVSGNDKRAGDLFERMKGQYGAGSCYLLRVNSRPSSVDSTESLPDPWSQFIRHQRYTTGEVTPPAKRSSLSRVLKHRDSADGVDSITANSINSLNIGVLKPDDVREEPTLNTDGDDDTDAPIPATLSSSNIELGTDPLSQQSLSVGGDRKVRSAHSSPLLVHINKVNSKRSASMDTLLQQPQQPVAGTAANTDDGTDSVRNTVRYGDHLTLEDHQRLQKFLEEFVTRGLLPHLEQLMRTMNERLASRQGFRRQFMSAARGWLGGGRRQSNASSVSHNNTGSSSYAHDSAELQMRQLGDLAFLLQNYELSYQTYNSVRRDYQADHAWLLYAGAVEMTALSLFMTGSNRKDLSSYFEDALAVYRSNTKNNPSLVLRCMLIYSEVLKYRSLYHDAAHAFVKMSGENNDLLCALCMEQAAHCFLKHKMKRKYSFHMILAGHRYSKAGQRMHSARSYVQALQVIKDKSWTLAEDYIHFSLARHSFNLRRLVEAKQAFEKLFTHRSAQLSSQQEANIKEYIFVHKQLLDQLGVSNTTVRLKGDTTAFTSSANTSHLPELPLPIIDVTRTRVIFGVDRWSPLQTQDGKQNLEVIGGRLSASPSPAGSKSNSRNSSPLLPKKNIDTSTTRLYSTGACEVGRPRQKWDELESIAAAAAAAKKQKKQSHKQILYLDHTTDNTQIACAVKNETIGVEVLMKNLIDVDINLSKVSLVWEMEQKLGQHQDPAVSCEVIKDYLLPASEQRMLCLHITPLCEGDLCVLAVICNIGVEGSPDLPPTSPLQSLLHSGRQFRLSTSSKDSVLQRSDSSDLGSYLSEGIQGMIPLAILRRTVRKVVNKRCTLVQEEDNRLSWQIVPAMPKLLVGICGFPHSLLAGEICRVSLELENFGQEPLHRLRLASSHHHLMIVEQGSETTKSTIYSTSVAEQAITSNTPATIKRQEVTEWKNIPLPDDKLLPGQKLQLSMLLQAPSNSGQHNVDMLYYYEPLQVTSKLDHRVVEQSCRLTVRDSLHVTMTQSASHQPCHSNEDNFSLDSFVVSLEMENKCQISNDNVTVREIRILQVTCASHQWMIQRCDKHQGIISLLPGMAALLHLKVMRVSDDDPTRSDENNIVFSDVPLGQTKVLTGKPPVCDLFFASTSCNQLCHKKSSNMQPQDNSWPVVDSNKMANTSHLALIIFWQALLPTTQGSKYSYGQQHLSIPVAASTSEQRPLTATNTSLEGPDCVKLSLQHSSHYPHDFTANRICTITIQVLLHNCSHCMMDVLLDFTAQDNTKSSTSSKVNSFQQLSQGFCWAGLCRKHLRIDKHSTTSVNIQACFTQPGVYNLGNFTFSASPDCRTVPYQLQRWLNNSLITVG